MLRNYLKAAFRHFAKHKVYTAINVSGLAVGMACCVLVALFIRDEWGYDRFHANADRIYRVIRETQGEDGRTAFSPKTTAALATQLEGLPQVERVLRLWNKEVWGGTHVRYGDKRFDHGICVAEPEILEVFDLPLVKGDPQTALRGPASIVLTEALAAKYFGGEDALGKVVTVEEDGGVDEFAGDYVVTGVLRDMPQKTTLRFPFITASPQGKNGPARWRAGRLGAGGRVETYVLLREGQEASALERGLEAIGRGLAGGPETEFAAYHAQPLTEIYLYSGRDYGLDKSGDFFSYGHITYLYQLGAVALAVLLIAGINYANLATALAVRRGAEVGVRKLVGARRGQLAWQYVGESVLLALAALVVALGLCEAALPVFNELTGKALNLGQGGWALAGLLAFAGAAGLLAGSYPAFFLSALRPVGALRGSVRVGGARLRQGLVALQFATTVFFVLCTAFVHAQLEYIDSKDLGFDRRQIIHLGLNVAPSRLVNPAGPLPPRYNEIKEAFLAHPNIVAASATVSTPPWFGFTAPVYPEGMEDDGLRMDINWVDEDFLETFDVELVAGRNFSRAVGGDATGAFLINETAAAQLGWDQPVGKRMALGDDAGREGVVVGVVEDFHSRTLRQAIPPMVLAMNVPNWTTLTLRFGPGEYGATLPFVEETYRRFVHLERFSYWDSMWSHHFLYRGEQRFGRVFRLVAGLSLFVSCLGLCGLASFAAERRTKEIGVRKALGATATDIVALVSGDFAKLAIAANVVAWPLTYWAMGRWLEDFAYRVDLAPWVFLAGGAATLLIAWLAVGGQTVRAALKNPVEALRYE